MSLARSLLSSTGIVGVALVATSCHSSTHAESATALSHRSLWDDAPATRPALDRFVPTDDAPLEQLIDYYENEEVRQESPAVSPVVRQRLLEASIAHPDLLPPLLYAMPTTPVACDAIKQLEDNYNIGVNSEGKDWIAAVHCWLMLHSRYYRAELTDTAKAAAGQGMDYVEGADAVQSLASLDWQAAQPVLQMLSNSPDSNVASIALVLRYRHSRAAGDTPTTVAIRDQLIKLSLDEREFSSARFEAARALFEEHWDGRVQWELSLIPGSMSEELSDSPSENPFEPDAEQLIPRLTALLKS